MSSHYTLTIRPSTGGARKFAVSGKEPEVAADCQSDSLWSQSDQTWESKVWERIDDRGYVCRLEGDGQWANRGDKGIYIGTGATAEAALAAAWSATNDGAEYDSDIPRRLLAPMRDYDAVVTPPAVE